MDVIHREWIAAITVFGFEHRHRHRHRRSTQHIVDVNNKRAH